MLDAKEFVKNRLSGQPTLYNAEKHIELMFEILGTGKDVSRFCKEVDIGRTTFYNWLKRHKEFKEAYEILLNHAESYWQDSADNSSINHSIWLYVMKTRFNPFKDYTKRTCLHDLSKCRTFGEMQRTILHKVAQGELTTEEGTVWVDLVGKIIKTEDVANLIERVLLLEKKLKGKNNES